MFYVEVCGAADGMTSLKLFPTKWFVEMGQWIVLWRRMVPFHFRSWISPESKKSTPRAPNLTTRLPSPSETPRRVRGFPVIGARISRNRVVVVVVVVFVIRSMPIFYDSKAQFIIHYLFIEAIVITKYLQSSPPSSNITSMKYVSPSQPSLPLEVRTWECY